MDKSSCIAMLLAPWSDLLELQSYCQWCKGQALKMQPYGAAGEREHSCKNRTAEHTPKEVELNKGPQKRKGEAREV